MGNQCPDYRGALSSVIISDYIRHIHGDFADVPCAGKLKNLSSDASFAPIPFAVTLALPSPNVAAADRAAPHHARVTFKLLSRLRRVEGIPSPDAVKSFDPVRVL